MKKKRSLHKSTAKSTLVFACTTNRSYFLRGFRFLTRLLGWRDCQSSPNLSPLVNSLLPIKPRPSIPLQASPASRASPEENIIKVRYATYSGVARHTSYFQTHIHLYTLYLRRFIIQHEMVSGLFFPYL